MGIWAWVQPVDRIWKVVSDYEKGKICVFNEKDSLIYEQKGLAREAVLLIEKNFLEVVATNLSETKSNIRQDTKKSIPEYNPMFA
ncbi:Uncharacterised protein [uncultured archaeon]|nr:Uncharacterised protein [uncultured archaeon]